MIGPGNSKLIAIRVPMALLQQIDEACGGLYASRAEFIRQAVIDKLADKPERQASDGVNILMSDRRLKEMQRALLWERHRRNTEKYSD